MTQNTRKIAVLTGDLVNSTGLGPAKIERAFAALEDCAATQAEWMGESLHFTRHRGDGWQVALAEPKYALRSALAFRAALRAQGEEFDSYIGIAEGEVEGEIGPDLNEETAKAFSVSGEKLEHVKSGEALADIKLSSTGIRMLYDRSTPQDALAIALDGYASEWTQVQAATIQEILSPDYDLNFSKTAIKLGKSRQTVTKTIRASQYVRISLALASMETWIDNNA
ncbi:hypothetical protein C8029_12755 [Roseobacter sp. TSBP12]|nr:hypothetical protein C8029_12755 [Roseobacter sp. TSBP12]|tara:strand:+ start:3529 stop:4203 length:675 start_codon:yes stop_codon:yes gene_type:complete